MPAGSWKLCPQVAWIHACKFVAKFRCFHFCLVFACWERVPISFQQWTGWVTAENEIPSRRRRWYSYCSHFACRLPSNPQALYILAYYVLDSMDIMSIHGFPWISLKFQNHWGSMDIHDSMDIIGYPHLWIWMELHGNHGFPQIPMDIHAYLWIPKISMHIHRYPRIPTNIYGYVTTPKDFCGYLVVFINIHGNVWISTRYPPYVPLLLDGICWVGCRRIEILSLPRPGDRGLCPWCLPSTAASPGIPAPGRGWAQIQPATDQIGKPFGEFSLQQFGSAVFCPRSACNGRPTPGICPRSARNGRPTLGICPRSACNGRPTPGICPCSARNVGPTSEICPSPARRCTPDPWNLSENLCFLSENISFLCFWQKFYNLDVQSPGICPNWIVFC